MPVTQLEAQLSTEQLFKAVQQMPRNELDKFVSWVLALRARYEASILSENESELLLKINRGLPFDLQRRYDELTEKRRAETLTAEEYKELLQLTEQVEKSHVERLEYLCKLADLRQVSLPALMDEFGIQPRAYV
jgi:hypothetical protein